MTRLQRQLIEFHRTFEHPILDSPTIPSDERVRLRASLVIEEALELVEALFGKDDLLDDARDSLHRVIARDTVKVDLVAVADALADIDYVVEGTRLEFGINGEPIADEVHRSNMAKAFVCTVCQGVARLSGEVCTRCEGRGKISLKRPDGKTVKPIDWTPPHIDLCLTAQQPRGPTASPDSLAYLLDVT
jgi:hypothetical protein